MCHKPPWRCLVTDSCMIRGNEVVPRSGARESGTSGRIGRNLNSAASEREAHGTTKQV
jgi:hypothetical protein